ncbi:MAG: M48 family metallopeptidase [Candidatus Omnitrophota bacterium]
MDVEEKARRYSRIKYGLIIGETGFFLAFCFFWQTSGFSAGLGAAVNSLAGTADPMVTGPVYLLFFSLVYYIVVFPAVFYQTFLLEHQFGLSRETMKSWFFDQAKAGLLTFVMSAGCLDAFYWALTAYPKMWWVWISAGWIAFNLVLAYLIPVFVVPMFFKYTRLPDGALRTRLGALAQTMGIRLLDIYHIDFSKRTTKANAALIGLGATKRVILSDTMQKTYTDDEIVVITAHEFAHSRGGHVTKLMSASALVSACFFYCVFLTYPATLSLWALPSLADPASIPVILLYLALLGMVSQPVINALCRRFESEADTAAVRATGLSAAFISAMDKLSGQNLSDRNPPAVLVWLFYSHPPVSKRIASARLIRV